MEHCTHHDINPQNGFCRDCKTIVTQATFVESNDYDDTRHAVRRRKTEKLLYPNREDIKLPDDIIDAAEAISKKFKIKANRDERLIRRRFVCLYYACLEAKKNECHKRLIINPITLANYVGMNIKHISKALTDFSAFRTGYQCSVVTDASFDLKPCTEIAIGNAKELEIPSDYFPIIEDMINIAMEKEGPELSRRTAQTVAAGAIKALLKTYPITIKKPAKPQAVGVSTSDVVSDIILKAYNA